VRIDEFLNNYPPEVIHLVSLARAYLNENTPGLREELDFPSKIIVYSIGAGMQATVFTLIPSKKSARIGFYRGRELEDPARLLEGRGRVHATIELSDVIFSRPEFQFLVNAAVNAARQRVKKDR
jgi:hypothetical protein